MPTENCLTHLVLGVIAGLPAVILAIATLMQVLKQGKDVKQLDQRVNGRLDELIQLREKIAWHEGHLEAWNLVEKSKKTPAKAREAPKSPGADDRIPFERPDPPAG